VAVVAVVLEKVDAVEELFREENMVDEESKQSEARENA